jgi:predicted TPR repeat methyltransferase
LTAASGETPASALALLQQSRLEHRQGRVLAALQLARKAIEIDPDNSDTQNELGDLYRSIGSSRGALEAYRRALELRPDHPEAARSLAVVLEKLKPLQESAAAHRRAIEQEPGNAEHLYALAAVCRDMGDIGAAVEALKKALAIRPEAHAFRRLGATLCAIGRRDEAEATYEAWLRAEPDSPLARHMLAACSGKDVPHRAPDAFVAAEFDRFADTFDQTLDQLEYRAPALLAKALHRIAGEPRGELDIVDAGCGTGQLAQHLRPYARRLVAVDLSPKMLEKAARRALYDQTSLAELAAFLRASPETFDVVAASDTLNYFGDLRDALAAARASLRPGGRLLFTLEHAAEEALPEGYCIHPNGRYSHTEAYVRRALAQAGFSLVEVETAHLRREGDAYVDGLVVSARRKEHDAQLENVASAIALHQRGQLAEAEAAYLAALEADKDNADALHYLGVLRHQQGQSFEALDLVWRALEIQPDYVDALNNLANIYRHLGSPAEAAKTYEVALALRPDHPEALRNRAIALREVERLEALADACRQAIARDALDVGNYYALAAAYKDLDRLDDAAEALRQALAIRPEAEGFRLLGQVLRWLRRTDEAAANYEAWLWNEPDNPIARHMLAACTLSEVPARASDAFVTTMFDGLAGSFDEALHRIEYRAPALVGQALQRAAGEPRQELGIVDVGCGTGLLAPYLRPYARRLVGVDLSPKMLAQAAQRALYDESVVAELGSFLRASPGGFDVVASSDTLVYFGELGEVLAAARRSLRPGGMLVFTLEHEANEAEAPSGYRIHPHGRYSHTEQYVRGALAEAGFDLVELGKANLRREGAAYVDGLVVAARAVGGTLSEASSSLKP